MRMNLSTPIGLLCQPMGILGKLEGNLLPVYHYILNLHRGAGKPNRYLFAHFSRQEEPNGNNSNGNQRAFTQYVFDNADYDIRTLTGHGTFHNLGGMRISTPAPTPTTTETVRRILHPPSAGAIAADGKLDINWYKKPPTTGLNKIKIRELAKLTNETLRCVFILLCSFQVIF